MSERVSGSEHAVVPELTRERLERVSKAELLLEQAVVEAHPEKKQRAQLFALMTELVAKREKPAVRDVLLELDQASMSLS